MQDAFQSTGSTTNSYDPYRSPTHSSTSSSPSGRFRLNPSLSFANSTGPTLSYPGTHHPADNGLTSTYQPSSVESTPPTMEAHSLPAVYAAPTGMPPPHSRAQSASVPSAHSTHRASHNPQETLKKLQLLRRQLSSTTQADVVMGLMEFKGMVQKDPSAAALACASGLLQPIVGLVEAGEQLLRVLALSALNAAAGAGSQEVCMGLAVAGILSTVEHLLVPPFLQPDRLDSATQGLELLAQLARHQQLCANITCCELMDKLMELLDRALPGKLVVQCCLLLQWLVGSQEWVADDLVTRFGLLSRLAPLLEPMGLDAAVRDAALEVMQAVAVYEHINAKVQQAVSLPLTTLIQLALDPQVVAYIMPKINDLKFDWRPEGPILPSPRGPRMTPNTPSPVEAEGDVHIRRTPDSLSSDPSTAGPRPAPHDPAASHPATSGREGADAGALNATSSPNTYARTDRQSADAGALNATSSPSTPPVDQQLLDSISCAFTTNSHPAPSSLPLPDPQAAYTALRVSQPSLQPITNMHAAATSAVHADDPGTIKTHAIHMDPSSPAHGNSSIVPPDSASSPNTVLPDAVLPDSLDDAGSQGTHDSMQATNPFICAKARSTSTSQQPFNPPSGLHLPPSELTGTTFSQRFGDSPSFKEFLQPRPHSNRGADRRVSTDWHALQNTPIPEEPAESAPHPITAEDTDERTAMHTLLPSPDLPTPPSTSSSVPHSNHTASSTHRNASDSMQQVTDVLASLCLHTQLPDSQPLFHTAAPAERLPMPTRNPSSEPQPHSRSASQTEGDAGMRVSHTAALGLEHFTSEVSLSHMLPGTRKPLNAQTLSQLAVADKSSANQSRQLAADEACSEVSSLSSHSSLLRAPAAGPPAPKHTRSESAILPSFVHHESSAEGTPQRNTTQRASAQGSHAIQQVTAEATQQQRTAQPPSSQSSHAVQQVTAEAMQQRRTAQRPSSQWSHAVQQVVSERRQQRPGERTLAQGSHGVERGIVQGGRYTNEKAAVQGPHTHDVTSTQGSQAVRVQTSQEPGHDLNGMRESVKRLTLADRFAQLELKSGSAGNESIRSSGNRPSATAPAAAPPPFEKVSRRSVEATLSQLLPMSDSYTSGSWASEDAMDMQFVTAERQPGGRASERAVVIVGDSASQHPSHQSCREGSERMLVLGQAPPTCGMEDGLPVCYQPPPKVLTAAETESMLVAKHQQAMQDQVGKVPTAPPPKDVSTSQAHNPIPKQKGLKGMFGFGGRNSRTTSSSHSQPGSTSPTPTPVPSQPSSTASATSTGSGSTHHSTHSRPRIQRASVSDAPLGAHHAVMDNEEGDIITSLHADQVLNRGPVPKGPSIPYTPISTGGSNSSHNSASTASTSRTGYEAQGTGASTTSKGSVAKKMFMNALKFTPEF